MSFTLKISLNENFKRLSANYLFSEIAARVGEYKAQNPEKKIISLGIGDVTRPLATCVSKEMARAATEMGGGEGFVGYGDTLGMQKLRSAISKRYARYGVELDVDEIFINDGAKSDLGNILDTLGDNEVLICDPIYPVYLDSSIISGKRVRLLSTNEKNGFVPSPRGLPPKPFVIYLCSPNNPTGAVFSYKQLREWVDFALESGSLIIFDAAYESYIHDIALPHSIFEIAGAKKCAVEVCSFSKMAGFTGVRCGWCAMSRTLPLHPLWERRQSTKFNGASYISQRGALAALSPRGVSENQKNIDYYMKNAHLLADFFKKKGVFFAGGENAPYIWAKQPEGMDAWEFFNYVLKHAQVVITPGVGFGSAGEGYFRLSSFANRDDALTAIKRLSRVL